MIQTCAFCIWTLFLFHLFFFLFFLLFLLSPDLFCIFIFFVMLSAFHDLFFSHCLILPPPPSLLYCCTLYDSSPDLAGRATSSPGWCYHRGWVADSGPPCWQEWQLPSWAGCGKFDLSAQSRSPQWIQCGSLLLSELLHLSQIGWKSYWERGGKTVI